MAESTQFAKSASAPARNRCATFRQNNKICKLMKLKSMLTLILISFSLTSFNDSEIVSKNGIQFFDGNWNEALKEAKSQNKNLFLDIYASWCGPCKQLKNKTFKDAEVGNYFNQNFINVRIDGETEEGIKLVKKYQVNSYPTLFIIDKNGNKLTKTTGFVKPYILINFGRRIVP